MSNADVFKGYIGKKVQVETSTGKIYGNLKTVDEKFIVVDTDNEKFYLESIVIAMDAIEKLGVLSGQDN
jgi:small nuclear ribonucleoprotein (snRNP)-like protein